MSIIETTDTSAAKPRELPSIAFRASENELRRTVELEAGGVIATPDTPLPPGFPDAEAFSAAVARHAVEALLGRRPVSQLQSWFSPALYTAFCRKVALTFTSSTAHFKRLPPVVKRIRCTYPRARVAEAAVLLHDGERMRAAAVRLEVRRSHWHVTALEIA